jgi:hypothetical protein
MSLTLPVMAEPSCLPCTPTWPAPWHTGKLTLKELDPAIHQEREQIFPDKLLLVIACSHACVDWSAYCFGCRYCCYSSYLEYANKQQLASFLHEENRLPRLLMSGLWLLPVLMIPPSMLKSGVPGSVLLHCSARTWSDSAKLAWPQSATHSVNTLFGHRPSCPVLQPFLGCCFGKKSWPAKDQKFTLSIADQLSDYKV